MIEINGPSLFSSRTSVRLDAHVKHQLRLTKDEVVEGKVIKSLSPNRAILLIKGKQVSAKIGMPLREGHLISLKVETTSPVPSLKPLIVRSQNTRPISLPTILSAVKENFWELIIKGKNQTGLPEPQGVLLRKIIDDLSSRFFVKPTPETLKMMIEKSGLGWEAKLKNALISRSINPQHLSDMIAEDLKGLVSKCLALNEESTSPLKRLMSALENIQMLNHLGLEQDRKVYLPMPIQFPDGFFTVGQLLIHLPEKEDEASSGRKKSKDTFKITFLLDMSQLGPIRADLVAKGNGIEGKFLLTKPETKSLIEEKLPEFVETLERMGFSIRYFNCYVMQPEIVKQSPVTEMMAFEESSLNLVA